ncbi:MAG: hypothetical protein ACI30I_02945, partial [Parabacteroides sp.]
ISTKLFPHFFQRKFETFLYTVDSLWVTKKKNQDLFFTRISFLPYYIREPIPLSDESTDTEPVRIPSPVRTQGFPLRPALAGRT